MILFSKCKAFGGPIVLFQSHEFKNKGATLTHTHTYTSNANVRSRIPAQVLAHIRGTCISYVRIGSLQERVIFVYISDEYDLLSSVSFQDINFWRGQNVRPDSEGGRIQLLHVGMMK